MMYRRRPNGISTKQLKDFLGSEADFFKMTNDDWLMALKDPSKFAQTIKSDGYVTYYSGGGWAYQLLYGLGNQFHKALSIGYDCYEYVSTPLNIFPVSQEGTVDLGGKLHSVEPGDFLIFINNQLGFFKKNDDIDIRMCDQNGMIYPNENVSSPH